jgi:hypothetical protein
VIDIILVLLSAVLAGVLVGQIANVAGWTVAVVTVFVVAGLFAIAARGEP